MVVCHLEYLAQNATCHVEITNVQYVLEKMCRRLNVPNVYQIVSMYLAGNVSVVPKIAETAYVVRVVCVMVAKTDGQGISVLSSVESDAKSNVNNLVVLSVKMGTLEKTAMSSVVKGA